MPRNSLSKPLLQAAKLVIAQRHTSECALVFLLLGWLTGCSSSSTANGVETCVDQVVAAGGRVEIHLDLSRSSISNEELGQMRLPEAIKSIDLSHTAITDEGIAHLVRADHLERISLVDLPITEKSIEYLKQMKSLYEVNMDQVDVPVKAQLELFELLTPRRQERMLKKHKA